MIFLLDGTLECDIVRFGRATNCSLETERLKIEAAGAPETYLLIYTASRSGRPQSEYAQ
jgi:hypothetical protein